jgi:hypothetical protein
MYIYLCVYVYGYTLREGMSATFELNSLTNTFVVHYSFIYTYAHVYICVCIYMYLCIYVYMHMYKCVFISHTCL